MSRADDLNQSALKSLIHKAVFNEQLVDNRVLKSL